jgi:hypothetical protein
MKAKQSKANRVPKSLAEVLILCTPAHRRVAMKCDGKQTKAKQNN